MASLPSRQGSQAAVVLSPNQPSVCSLPCPQVWWLVVPERGCLTRSHCDPLSLAQGQQSPWAQVYPQCLQKPVLPQTQFRCSREATASTSSCRHQMAACGLCVSANPGDHMPGCVLSLPQAV